eukprot:gnl/MRDRNA2_/MRDRNA2_35512_c0_seq1.p1 gnl/MRDRNA2_/MRDRNA2_35512_c0~~gnl/MRDRNA2_/MRDRNA2_35512_c0_seq1.p1  ORF type:complete len:881 (+),score=236.47 gnl/MRDRNA2_/MRDRNA2_35512_c0_seq1:136-2778(+)
MRGRIALWLCAALSVAGQLDPPLQVPLNTDPRFVPIIQELEYMLNSIVELMKNHEDRAGFCRGMRYGYDRVSALDVSQEQNTAWALKQVRDEILHLCSSGSLKNEYLPQHIEMMKKVLHAYLSSVQNEAKRQEFLKRQAGGVEPPQGLPQVETAQMLYSPTGPPATAAEYQEASEPLLEPLPAEEEAEEDRLEEVEDMPAEADDQTKVEAPSQPEATPQAQAIDTQQPLLAPSQSVQQPPPVPPPQAQPTDTQQSVIAPSQSVQQPQPVPQPQQISSETAASGIPEVQPSMQAQEQAQQPAQQLQPLVVTQAPAQEIPAPAAASPVVQSPMQPQPPMQVQPPGMQVVQAPVQPQPQPQMPPQPLTQQVVVQPLQVPMHLQAAAAAEQEAIRRGADAARAAAEEQRLHIAEEKARVKVQAAEERLRRARRRLRLRKERLANAKAAQAAKAPMSPSHIPVAIPVQAQQPPQLPLQMQPAQPPQQTQPQPPQPPLQMQPQAQPLPAQLPQPSQPPQASQQQMQFHIKPLVELPPLLQPPQQDPQLKQQPSQLPPQPQVQSQSQPQQPPQAPQQLTQSQQLAQQVWPSMEERPSASPTQAPRKKPLPLSANDVAAELLRQGELMKKQSSAMSARVGRSARHEPLVKPVDPAAHDAKNAEDGRQIVASVSTSPLLSNSSQSFGQSTRNESISHARKALHDVTERELDEQDNPAASAIKRALDDQNADQSRAVVASDDVSTQASDAGLTPMAAAENDAVHMDRLQQLINKLHKRTAKDAGEPAKYFLAPSTTIAPRTGSDRALQMERRSRAGLESFIHSADDIVKEEQFEQIKAERDAKERARQRQQLKLSLRDLGEHPITTDLSSALDSAMVSESMSMPGSFILR